MATAPGTQSTSGALAAVSNIFTYKPKHVYPNSAIIENSKAVKEDSNYIKKIQHVSEKQMQCSQAKREVDLKFADAIREYSNTLKASDATSVLARACECTSTYLFQIEAKQARLDSFVANSFVAPLMTFVRGDIALALEAKGKYDRALQGYDQQINTLEELKKKKQGQQKGKAYQKAEQDLFLMKQTFEQADLDARNKLQDTRTKNFFQSLEYVCNLATAYTEFFTEGLECMKAFQEQMQEFKTCYEKSRDDYLSTQLKRPQVMVMKPKLQKRAVYGVDIQEVWANENVPPDKLPAFLQSIFSTLFYKNLKLEGIFRLSANKEEVKAFKVAIDQGNLPDFSTVDDPHVISNLLSVWLRELPAPLCTLPLYERFLAVQASHENKKAYIHMLSNTIKQLPGPNKTVLQHLLHLLANIALHSEVNKMTYSNLAIVFGPTILYGPKADAMTFAVVNAVVENMIQHYEELFGEPVSTDKYGARPKRPDRPMSIMPRTGGSFPKTPPPERPLVGQFGGLPIPNDISAAAAAAAAERPARSSLLSSSESVPKPGRPGSQFGMVSMPIMKSKSAVNERERPVSSWQTPLVPQASSSKKTLSLFIRPGTKLVDTDTSEASPKAEATPTATPDASPRPLDSPGAEALGVRSAPSRPPIPSRTERPILSESLSGSSLTALLRGASPRVDPTTSEPSNTALPSPKIPPERPVRPARPLSKIPDFAPPNPTVAGVVSYAGRRSVSVADVEEAKAYAAQKEMQLAALSPRRQPEVWEERHYEDEGAGEEDPNSAAYEEGAGGGEQDGWYEEEYVEVEYELDEYQGEYQYEGNEGAAGDYYGGEGEGEYEGGEGEYEGGEGEYEGGEAGAGAE